MDLAEMISLLAGWIRRHSKSAKGPGRSRLSGPFYVIVAIYFVEGAAGAGAGVDAVVEPLPLVEDVEADVVLLDSEDFGFALP